MTQTYYKMETPFPIAGLQVTVPQTYCTDTGFTGFLEYSLNSGKAGKVHKIHKSTNATVDISGLKPQMFFLNPCWEFHREFHNEVKSKDSLEFFNIKYFKLRQSVL